jgi:predicted ATP-grasp superfamily ATP-dependent carboligase
MKVFVLGGKKASVLRLSRYCERFIPAHAGDPEAGDADPIAWTQEIECVATQYGIDMVMAADTQATLLLARLHGRLTVRSYPMPTPAALDVLSDKWNFRRMCSELGLRAPQTWLFPDKPAVLDAIRAGELPENLISKPLRKSGSYGVTAFGAADAVRKLERIDYEPILVQEYMHGLTICLSIQTWKGIVVAALGYHKDGHRYILKLNDQFLAAASAVAAHLRTDGLLNFDAQLTENGDLYLLECNPRMFLSMDYAAIAGINFVELGLRDWSKCRGGCVPSPEQSVLSLGGLLLSLATPWRIRRADLRMARYGLADPVIQALEWIRRGLIKCPHGLRKALRQAGVLRSLLD